MNNKNLALFDFDGTISNKDSFFIFIRFYVSKWRFLKGSLLLLPILIAYKLKILDNEKAKKYVIKHFFEGETEENFNKKCTIFGNEKLPLIIRKTAKKALQQHRKQGDRIIIVSASLENYLVQWCKNNDFELIATKLATENGIITGDFVGENCHGQEKVNRIKSYLNIADYQGDNEGNNKEIYAYGDTSGDLPMLKLATKPFYKHFK